MTCNVIMTLYDVGVEMRAGSISYKLRFTRICKEIEDEGSDKTSRLDFMGGT